jgi:dienelactone hydrolase
MRRALTILAWIAAVITVAGIGTTIYLLRDQTPRFAARRSQLASAVVDTGSTAGDVVETVRLRASSGLVVDLSVRNPSAALPAGSSDGRRPLVVILGGHNTGRNAVHLVGDTRGVLVAALSYPFDGNHRAKGLAVVRQVPKIRRAVFDTPPAIMLALDYLLARPDVDPRRVELVGVSFGAPFVTIAAALDPRVSRVWSVHGTGGVYTPLEHNLRRQFGGRLASVPVAAVATIALSGSQLAPERWAPAIAPRPFMMINAQDDTRLPRRAIDRLYDSARDPKEMIWTTGGHVRSEADVVRPLVELILGRMLGPDGRPSP